MNITFRPARDSDRLAFDWKPYGADQRKPSVVTINGKVALMTGENGVVLFQYGGEGVSDLIRAQRRVFAAIGQMSYVDRQVFRRTR